MKNALTIVGFFLICQISALGQSVKYPNLSYISQKTDIDLIGAGNVSGGKYNGIYYKYKKKEYTVEDLQMYDAITSKNIQLIKQLISNGYDITIPIITKDFSDISTDISSFHSNSFGLLSNGIVANFIKYGSFVDLPNFFYKIDNDGFICTSYKPTPAIKTTPLEYAKSINDTEIISVLSREFAKQLSEKNTIDSLKYAISIPKEDSLLNLSPRLVVPGQGFDNVKISVTTFNDLEKYFGYNYEKINHNKSSIEIYYKNLGVSFYFDYENILGSIYYIELKSPFKGVINGAINALGLLTCADVINSYGKPKQLSWDINFFYSYLEYAGIKFVVDGNLPSIHEAKKLNKKIIEIDIRRTK